MTEKNIGKQINAIYRHMQILINHELSQYGLGSGQYIFLGTIAQNQGISQKELSSLLKVDKATTAKALKKLESEGYIVRKKDANDRRYNSLYMTSKGDGFLPILVEKLAEATDLLTKNTDKAQQDYLLEVLEIVMKNAISAVDDIRK